MEAFITALTLGLLIWGNYRYVSQGYRCVYLLPE